jgi:hypothetical protein
MGVKLVCHHKGRMYFESVLRIGLCLNVIDRRRQWDRNNYMVRGLIHRTLHWNVIVVIKLMNMRWVGYVEHVAKDYKILVGSP